MKKTDLFYFILLFVLLLAVFYLIFLLKSETSQCVKNPFIYGSQKLGGEISCSCFKVQNQEMAKFSFTEQGFNPEVEVSEFNFNVTLK